MHQVNIEIDLEDDDPFGGPSMFVDEDGVVQFNRNSDCAFVEAAGVAICYAWNSDNRGPHTVSDAKAILDTMRKEFPQAQIETSDAFDDFVDDVWPFLHTLPVVTGEIGDTWIYGLLLFLLLLLLSCKRTLNQGTNALSNNLVATVDTTIRPCRSECLVFKLRTMSL